MFYSPLQIHAILANQQVGHGGLISFQEGLSLYIHNIFSRSNVAGKKAKIIK